MEKYLKQFEERCSLLSKRYSFSKVETKDALRDLVKNNEKLSTQVEKLSDSLVKEANALLALAQERSDVDQLKLGENLKERSQEAIKLFFEKNFG